MALRAMELYEAYEKNMLPKDEGYVVSAFYLPDSPYSILEVISYSEVKNFFASNDSLTFQSNGKKIYILVEPSSYNHKSQEPYVRPSKYQIPLRFNDLNIYTCKNQYKVMYNKEPQMMMTSFTVLKPTGHNFSLIVFQQDDIQKTLAKLFQSALHNESNVPLNDSKVISEDLAEMIVTKLCWPNKKTAKKAKKSSEVSAKEEKTSSTKKSTAKKADAKSTSKAKTAEKKSTSAKNTDAKASSTKKTTAKTTAEKKTSTAKKSTTEKKTSTAKSDTKSTKTASSTKKTTAKKDTSAKTSAKKAS
ncbi:MAG: hypothetical protein II232_03185, partial [Spirochaetaceae bacterium]|nr:hypothetical protein [Spirochaetaceae bacterium]